MAPPTLAPPPPSPQASTLTQKDIRTLEQTRQRLFQLTNSLSALRMSLASKPDTLPPWPSLQSQSSIIAGNLSSLTAHLSTDSSRDLLQALSTAPLPAFPVKEEDVLTQLVRKKGEVGVEIAMESAESVGREVGTGWEEVWKWAAPRVNEIARARDWEGEFTVEEREGEGGVGAVVTGLKRVLEAESDEEDEVEKVIPGPPPLKLEDWLRFESTGKRRVG
ncbi:MAG: mediator of RNA polymerase II transcription subunit 8 [Vezdaea aestivalis]|nr:MAG: mediator of RNA polymerase II transcription subunit 8 [Vezdaea aestivalis]